MRGLRDEGVDCDIILPGQGEFADRLLAEGFSVIPVPLHRLRKLIGRNLRCAAGLRDFEAHGSFVDDAKVAGETGGLFRS